MCRKRLLFKSFSFFFVLKGLLLFVLLKYIQVLGFAAATWQSHFGRSSHVCFMNISISAIWVSYRPQQLLQNKPLSVTVIRYSKRSTHQRLGTTWDDLVPFDMPGNPR